MNREIENYRRKLFVSDLNHFILPWQSVVFKNINIRTGKLVHYNSLKKFKKNNVPLWVVARLYLFCENNNYIHSVIKDVRVGEFYGSKQTKIQLSHTEFFTMAVY